MSQRGETDGYSLADYHRALEAHAGPGLVTHVLFNNAVIDEAIVSRYKAEQAAPVQMTSADGQYFKEKGITLLLDDYVEVVKGYIRHDALKVALRLEALVDIKIYRHGE